MKKIIVLLVLSFSFITQSQNQIISKAEYSIKNVAFNSKYSDFGTAFFEKGLIFASERDTGFSAKRRHRIKDKLRPFLQLFKFDGNGNVCRMRPEINQKYHESTVAITQDGQTMYFTRNNTDHEGDLRVSDENITLLKLYRSSKNAEGKWNEGRPVSFCSDNYSVAHPSLSKDGKWLYFASDMPGSLGKSDIYRAPINENGVLGIPENLGPKINSDSSDSFPFIAASGDLYFASDRAGGLGGLDLYVAHEESSMSLVSNLGSSINSTNDDFALILDENKKHGYFSSNRQGGMGDDDIYSFTEISPYKFECKKSWIITILDKETMEPINNPIIKLNSSENSTDLTLSEINEKFSTETSCDLSNLTIISSKEGYEDMTLTVNLNQIANNEIRLLMNKKRIVLHEVGMDLGKELGLIPINFASNRWDILPEAAQKLQKLIDYMKLYPTVKIEIGSHTDARGSDAYNMKLSQNRAKATAKYISENGIDKNRLIAKGYGETKLLNVNCSNGKKCSDEEHVKNRRSEFIVIEN